MARTRKFSGTVRWAAVLLLSLVVLQSPVFFSRSQGASLPGLTAEEKAWLAENPDKLTLFFNTEFPPIEFMSDSGTFTGMGADVVALVEKKLGVTFIKRPCPDWNRHLAALADGTCAVAPTIVATPARERFAYFTSPYATAPVVIITRRGKSRGMTLDELAGKKVAVVSGFATEAYARAKAQGRFEIMPVANVPEGLFSVSLGHVDAFLENLAVAAYYIDKAGISNLSVAGVTDYFFDWSIGISRKYPLLFSAMQKALAVIPQKELTAIHKKWIPLEVATWLSSETWRLIKVITGFTVLLLIGLAVISYILKRRLNEKVANLKKAQQQIVDQADRLRLATEALNAGVWDYYPLLGNSYLSSQWYAMLGYPGEGRNIPLVEFKRLVHPEDRSVLENALKGYIVAGGRGQFEVEFRLRKADGDWCWVLSKGQAVEWSQNNAVSRIVGLDINIESIKRNQERVTRSEAWFRAIFENAPYAIAITRLADNRYLAANRAFLESRKINSDQLVHLNTKDFTSVSEDEAVKVLTTLMEKGVVKNREARVKAGDGTWRDVVYSSVLMEIQGEKQVLSITLDVTERKKAQQALAESEARFRALFKMAPIPMATLSMDGRVLDVNDRLTEVLGYVIDDIPTLEDWWRLAHPDPEYRRRLIADWNEAFDRVSTSTAPYNLGEIRVTCKNGTELTTIINTNRIRDFIVASFFDITERKLAEQERQKLQEQLLQSQKLEAVGVLAGGVAHDFNNMLGAITGFAELALQTMDAGSPEIQYLKHIQEAARHSVELTSQLLAFARKQAIAPTTLDLNRSVESMLNILRRLLGENIELNWRPMNGACIVRLDPSQLSQVLTNLCVNARDAIEDVGKITIETAAVSFDKDYCEVHGGFVPGHYMMLAVSDDGAGMDRETIDHIFDPFFTTKQQGKGTGLGLAMIYGIVKQNEGFVNVYSEPGRGTTFRIYFPCHATEDEPILPEEVNEVPYSRGETILMVEDDPLFRDMGITMLRRLGYNVMAAATPGEAIKMAQTHGPTFDLMITDVIMPEMNGRDLAARIKEVSPDIKLLFMSGYTADVIVNRGVLEEGIHFIQKPFSLTEVAARIREVLDHEA